MTAGVKAACAEPADYPIMNAIQIMTDQNVQAGHIEEAPLIEEALEQILTSRRSRMRRTSGRTSGATCPAILNSSCAIRASTNARSSATRG